MLLYLEAATAIRKTKVERNPPLKKKKKKKSRGFVRTEGGRNEGEQLKGRELTE